MKLIPTMKLKGYTLLDLLVPVAIIMILFGVLLLLLPPVIKQFGPKIIPVICILSILICLIKIKKLANANKKEETKKEK
jgi:competence protein ComGC